MRVKVESLLVASAVLGLGLPACAHAQDKGPELMSMGVPQLRSEIGRRYDEALGLTKDQGVVSRDSSQFFWATQAKVQCGIATGFLKSGIKDPVSVGKCDDAYNRMHGPVAAPAPAPAPVAACNKGPYIVFFDWDRSDITAEAGSILDNAVATYAGCENAPIKVAGYADRSGGDAYNQALSERRAAAVRTYFTAHGVPDTAITAQGFGENNPRVPTADGVRELQNRRVEITFE